MSERLRTWDERAQYDAVVIGTGLGGLATGAILSRRGFRVLALEQHSVAGGNATAFRRRSYRFDVGVHYLGDCGSPTGTIPAVLAEAGVSVKFLPMDPDGFDTLCFPDGTTFAYPRGVDRFEARLLQAFPREARGIRRWCRFLRQTRRLNCADGALALLAAVPRSLFAVKHRDSTLAQVLDDCTADPRLRAVLCGPHGDHAVAPSRVSALLHAGMVMHYLVDGAWYPEGGGQELSDRLVDVIEAAGGKVLLLSLAERILVEGGRVAGVTFRSHHLGRRTVRAPAVICNADVKETFLRLLPGDQVPPGLRERVERYEMAPGFAVLFLGVKREALGEAPLKNTNFWVFPGDDVERDYAALREDRFVEDPTVLISIASTRDPGRALAPPGVVNLQLIALAPSSARAWGVEGLASYRRAAPYLEKKRALRDRLVRQACRVFPGLAQGIVYEELATPLTHARFTRSTNGTSYGLAATPAQFNGGRPDAVTHLRGLFLAGASTRSGHGVTGALASGRAAAHAASDYLARRAAQSSRARRESRPDEECRATPHPGPLPEPGERGTNR